MVSWLYENRFSHKSVPKGKIGLHGGTISALITNRIKQIYTVKRPKQNNAKIGRSIFEFFLNTVDNLKMVSIINSKWSYRCENISKIYFIVEFLITV